PASRVSSTARRSNAPPGYAKSATLRPVSCSRSCLHPAISSRARGAGPRESAAGARVRPAADARREGSPAIAAAPPPRGAAPPGRVSPAGAEVVRRQEEGRREAELDEDWERVLVGVPPAVVEGDRRDAVGLPAVAADRGDDLGQGDEAPPAAREFPQLALEAAGREAEVPAVVGAYGRGGRSLRRDVGIHEDHARADRRPPSPTAPRVTGAGGRRRAGARSALAPGRRTCAACGRGGSRTRRSACAPRRRRGKARRGGAARPPSRTIRGARGCGRTARGPACSA